MFKIQYKKRWHYVPHDAHELALSNKWWQENVPSFLKSSTINATAKYLNISSDYWGAIMTVDQRIVTMFRNRDKILSLLNK